MARLDSILLLGATGSIGIYFLKALTASRSKFKRVAILTSEKTTNEKAELLKEYTSQGIEILTADLEDDESVTKAFADFDTIISAFGRAAMELNLRLISIAASIPSSGGPRRFYPSEFGTDIKFDPKTSPHETPNQQKLKIRAHIEDLARQGKIEYTYIVCGPFADVVFENKGKKGFNREAKEWGIIGSPDKPVKISSTRRSDVAKYLVSSLLTPEASKNATIHVNSFTATPEEMQDSLEQHLGYKLKAVYTSLEDYKAMEKEAYQKDDPGKVMLTLYRIWYEGGSDFSSLPTAVYMKQDGSGDEVDERRSSMLFQDVEKTGIAQVVAAEIEK